MLAIRFLTITIFYKISCLKSKSWRASLVSQWQRICLPMQEIQVWSLIQEDPICHRTTKPRHYDYWVCAPEPRSRSYWAQMLHLLRPAHSRACALQQGKWPQWEACAVQLKTSPCSLQLEKSLPSNNVPVQTKILNKIIFLKTAHTNS